MAMTDQEIMRMFYVAQEHREGVPYGQDPMFVVGMLDGMKLALTHPEWVQAFMRIASRWEADGGSVPPHNSYDPILMALPMEELA